MLTATWNQPPTLRQGSMAIRLVVRAAPSSSRSQVRLTMAVALSILPSLWPGALPGHANAYTRSMPPRAALPPPKDGGAATVRQRGLLPAAPLSPPPPPSEVASRPMCTTASGPSALPVRAQALLLDPAAARVVMVSVCSLQLV